MWFRRWDGLFVSWPSWFCSLWSSWMAHCWSSGCDAPMRESKTSPRVKRTSERRRVFNQKRLLMLSQAHLKPSPRALRVSVAGIRRASIRFTTFTGWVLVLSERPWTWGFVWRRNLRWIASIGCRTWHNSGGVPWACPSSWRTIRSSISGKYCTISSAVTPICSTRSPSTWWRVDRRTLRASRLSVSRSRWTAPRPFRTWNACWRIAPSWLGNGWSKERPIHRILCEMWRAKTAPPITSSYSTSMSYPASTWRRKSLNFSTNPRWLTASSAPLSSPPTSWTSRHRCQPTNRSSCYWKIRAAPSRSISRRSDLTNSPVIWPGNVATAMSSPKFTVTISFFKSNLLQVYKCWNTFKPGLLFFQLYPNEAQFSFE